MPEGDTVYRSATNLNSALAGRTLTRCDIRVPAFATVDLTGEPVESVSSRGKHILMRIGEYTLHSHLKMEGSWHLYRHGAKWFRPEFQARAILATDEVLAVGFDLGQFEVLRRPDEDQAVGYLGPDLLGSDWDPALALANLLSDPTREVGLALLDQRNLAGLGNVYRAELCFLRGILPTRPVGEVTEPEKLIEFAWRLIDANKDRAIRTTTGRLTGQRLWVYRRTGKPCFRCDTPIERAQLGDPELQQRDVWWCPSCQA
ncbi:MAG: DNA-formamidopyrimidine glycosylase family protein [Rhodoglobus sp.]|nr:DNA-formamidopyrimidine glycosylase family protein [Rhodoglobus sp.]